MLIESLKGLGHTFIDIVCTRLELLSLDLREHRIHFISTLMLGAFAFLTLSLGIILGLFWLLITFWESDRLLVLGVLTILLFSCGFILMIIFIWKLRSSSGAFNSTIAELKKDNEALSRKRKRND